MLIDFALKRLIAPGANDPRITARIGIWHVDAGNAFSLEDYFRNRSGGIESHGHVRSDGELEQYRDTDYEADANYKANPFALSFETQGLEFGTWNEAQLATIKRTIMWGHEHHNIALRLPKTWNDPKGGWGYHTLFDEWRPFAKSCPGPRRKEQFHDIIVPWMKDGGDDMSFSKADEERLERIETTVNDLAVAFQNFRGHNLERDVNLRKRVASNHRISEKLLDQILKDLATDAPPVGE